MRDMKVTHVMADGRILSSVRCLPVPDTRETAYKVMTEALRRERNEKKGSIKEGTE